MSDLKERLRAGDVSDVDAKEAADRIEELEKALSRVLSLWVDENSISEKDAMEIADVFRGLKR